MAPAFNYNLPRQLNEPFLLIGNTEACYRVPVTDIIYCTAHNSSTQFQLVGNRKLVAGNSIAYYEDLLANYGFVRIHQSHLVNSACLFAIAKGDESNRAVLITGEKLPIARARKTEVILQLKQLSIENISAHQQPNNNLTIPKNHHTLPNSQKASTE
ncbi:MAG: LytTR family transcriptional regulator DNA-binding domain-containing protein [Chitinophagales bacterium]|nr:LytTR family transcriptional regulator DNA-binding domain-containing protein [Chitinophagales bacterium]